MATTVFVLNYNANGGIGAPSSQSWRGEASHHSFTIPSTRPSRTGYTFRGWALSSSATTATHQPGSTFSASPGTNTLYAVWSVITYTVTYYPGEDGTGNSFSRQKTYNVALTLAGASFTRTGYTQTGWATSDGGAQAYALSASYTANASVALYPVWTATKSTVSTTDGTLGTQQTITITRYNNSFTHTLTGKYGNYSWTIATGVGASYAWTPGVDLAAQFPAAKSGLCTITCTTYSGSTNIGSSTTTCYLAIPSSVCCTVGTVTLTEAVSGLASKFGAFIQGKSKATISATINSGSGSPAYGATVSSYAITTNGQTLTSNGATTGILNTAGTNNSYSFKITDTRGYSNTKTDTYTVLAYSSPSVSAQISRNSSDSSKIDVKYSYSISACNNRNDKSLSIKYRVVGGNYTTIPITISSYTGSNLTYQITGLDANTAYEIVVTVTDYFSSVSTTANIQPTGNRVFDISDDDKTIARHGTNYSDGWDHQYFNEQFHGVLDVTPRRCYSWLSQRGWYRVFDYNADNEARVSGDIAFLIDVTVLEWARQSHKITLYGLLGALKFWDEVSVTNTSYVDEIRYVKNGTHGYIDIHYDGSSSRHIACYFDVKCVYIDNLWRFTAVTPTKVDDSPVSPATELTNYTFVENTGVPVSFSPTSGSVYRACWYARIGNVCYLHVDMQGLTPSTNTKIFTLPVGYRPLYSTTIPGAGQESYGALASCSIQTDGSVYIYSQDHYAIIDGNFICQV